LFYVDTAPNPDHKHYENEVLKPAYRLEIGNLLLPEHVLLETVEEAIPTPGTEALPPPSPVSSEESIDIVDDNLKVRYIAALEVNWAACLSNVITTSILVGIGNRKPLQEKLKNVAFVGFAIPPSYA
jgi:hypothetical protein